MKILFLSLKEQGYSRTWTYYSYLKSQSRSCEYVQIKPGSMLKDLRRARNESLADKKVIIVGSASQILVIPALIVFKAKPFLDAGWSLFESTIVNRKRAGKFRGKAVKTYLIDLVATIFSRKVFLESKQQIAWYRKIFLTNKNKCIVLYTGLDESEFTPKVSIANKHKTTFKIVFRGKNNDEAGLEILARATEILADEDISFEVISNVGESNMKFSARTNVVGDFFKSKNLIASLLKDADLSLGQLSGHKRLRRTIPHKAFESAFLGVPYLTARSSGILEIFQENVEIFCFDPGSAEDLVAKIRFLKSNRKLLAESGTKMKEKYSKKLSQEILAQELMEIIRGK